MAEPQEIVKERVWKVLTAGLDPDDIRGCIDDIKDNTSYAIDVAIFETANAIFEDIWGAACIDCHNKVKVRRYHDIKKKWLVPVPEPEPDVLDVSVPDWIYETPIGKKAAKDADMIVQSIKEHQMKKMENEKRIRRRAYE